MEYFASQKFCAKEVYLTLKKYFNRFPRTVYFVLLLAIYLPILNSPPFGDDYHFLFESNSMKVARSAFDFWVKGSALHKSWPLSYSIFWTLYQNLTDHYFAYRLIGLAAHFTNFILLLSIAQNIFPKKNNLLAATLFLYHPAVVLTILSIFQLKTLLALTFYLLAVRFLLIEDFKKKFVGLVFFSFSLLIKPIAVLAPLMIIFYMFNRRITGKSLLIAAMLFVASLYVGINTYSAIVGSPAESRSLAEFYSMRGSSQPAASSIDLLTHFSKKIVVNLEHFTKKLFLLKPNQIVYQESTITWFAFVALLALIAAFQTSTLCTASAVMFFMPISGLFYIPYHKYSLSFDSWIYPILPFSLICLSGLSRKILTPLVAILISATALSVLNFSNLEQQLKDEISLQPTSVFLNDSLIQYYRQSDNPIKALNFIRTNTNHLKNTNNNYSLVGLSLAVQVNSENDILYFCTELKNYCMLENHQEVTERDLEKLKMVLKVK